MRMVIIGNGPAGVAAAQKIKEIDKKGEVLLISEERECYSKVLIPTYIATRGSFSPIFVSREALERMGIKTLFGGRVVDLDVKGSSIALENGEKMSYDKLLLALGGRPTPLQIPGVENKGVYYLDSWESISSLIKHCKEKKNITILGGGLTGLKMAMAFHRLNLKVLVLEEKTQILSDYVDEVGGDLIQNHLKKNGISIDCQKRVEEIRLGKKGLEIKIAHHPMVLTDSILITGGIIPARDVISKTPLRMGNGLSVDASMQTNVKSIYGAGDMIDISLGDTQNYPKEKTWINATTQGILAGENMTGEQKILNQLYSFHVEDYLGLPLLHLGGPPSTRGDEIYGNRNEKTYERYVFVDDELVEALIIGDATKGLCLLGLINQRKKMKRLSKDILSGHLNYHEIAYSKGE